MERSARLRQRVPAVVIAAMLVSLALGIAAAGVYKIAHHLNHTLQVSTDVIGYPVFHAFDPFVYHDYYYLAVIVFPVAALVGTMVLWWLGRRINLPLPRREWWPNAEAKSADGIDKATSPTFATLILRTLTVGGVFGLIGAVARGDAGTSFWRDVVAAGVLYMVAVGVSAVACSRRGTTTATRIKLWISRINAIGGVLTLVGVLVASSLTEVLVTSDHTTHLYPWFPMWAGVIVVLGGLALAIRALMRAGNDLLAVARIERRLVFLVAFPVAVFVTLSGLASAVAGFDVFEGGQQVATVRFLEAGEFPWRDWISIHGLLEDTLKPLFGSLLFQNSAWGVTAGITLILAPLRLLGFYFLSYRVAGARWPVLILVTLSFFQSSYGNLILIAFLFWPVLLILMWSVLERRSARVPAIFGALIAVQAIISPETAYCVPAVGLAVLGNDLFSGEWRAGGSKLRAFTNTWATLAGGLVVATIFLVVLVAHHAVGDFIGYYTTFAVDHDLSGALPHEPLVGVYLVSVIAPVAAMLATFGILSIKAWLRHRLDKLDWLMFASAVVVLLYYPKFLDRADEHVQEVFAVATPLFIILIAQVLRYVEPSITRGLMWLLRRATAMLRWRRPIPRFSNFLGTAVMIALFTQVAAQLDTTAEKTPDNFRITAAAEPWSSDLGYTTSTAFNRPLLNDVNTFLHAYLKPGDKIFDMTNEPGFLYYLMDFSPVSPYYNISVAIRGTIQEDVIADLKKDRPLFVVFAQQEIGLYSWDEVPNMVRHYDISQYILANYRPFADVHGQAIYVERSASVPDPTTLGLSLSTPLVTTDIPFLGTSCDWRFTPDYLSVAPASGAQPVEVNVTQVSPTSLDLSLPAGKSWGDFDWIELQPASQFTASAYVLQDRPSPPGEARTITFSTSTTSPHTYRFPIGACSQWYGYGNATLHLTMTVPEQIASVSVVP